MNSNNADFESFLFKLVIDVTIDNFEKNSITFTTLIQLFNYF